MLNNFFILKELVKYFNASCQNSVIIDIFSQEKGKLVFHIKPDNANSDLFLEISCLKQLPYITLKDNFQKAKKNVTSLFTALESSSIKSLELYENDRIVKINLLCDYELFYTAISQKLNILLISNNIIINSFKNSVSLIGTTLEEFLSIKSDKSASNDNRIKNYIYTNFSSFGKEYIAECLYNFGFSGDDNLSEDNKNKIDSFFSSLEKKFCNPDYILYRNNGAVFASLMYLEHLLGWDSLVFNNIIELSNSYIKNQLYFDSLTCLKEKTSNSKETELKLLRKKIISIEKQLEVSGNSDIFLRYGNELLGNAYLITKGSLQYIFTNQEGTQISIPLKPGMSPSENARFYFEKYKRYKSSLNELVKKINSFKKKEKLLEQEIHEYESITDFKLLKKMDKKLEKKIDEKTTPFRHFPVGEGYEVLVGKNSASNDKLTFKYASQNDLWFHVRGASGSHTVLKIENKKVLPDKSIIAKAASIAAYYSKARNSTNVPVAYCERKYVKKKKGFKEGSVVMEKEKVIFVKPALPENL
ncbi:DUF814 domain-containing protein [bacterium]|nr:MAG: DUF814 domain-containing protein [bacterium]